MKRKWKQFTAGILSLCMVLGLMPTAFASTFTKSSDGVQLYEIKDTNGALTLDGAQTVKESQLVAAAINTAGLHNYNANYYWRTVAQLAYASHFSEAKGKQTDVFTSIDNMDAFVATGGGTLSNSTVQYACSDPDYPNEIWETQNKKASYASSVSNAYSAMANEIMKASNQNDGNFSKVEDAVETTLEGVSDNNAKQDTMYFWEGGFVKNGTQDYVDGHYTALGIIYSNFQMHPTMDVAAGDVSLKLDSGKKTEDDSTPYVTGASNSTSVPVSIAQTLEQNITETASNSLSKSDTYSFGENLSVSSTVSAEATSGFATVAASFTTSVGISAEQAFNTTKEQATSKSVSSTMGSTVELALPAQTSVQLKQSTERQTATQTYRCPVEITYDVNIICVNRDLNDDNRKYATELCSFSGDAQQECANRFLETSAADDDRIDWEQGLKSLYWYTGQAGAVQRAETYLGYPLFGTDGDKENSKSYTSYNKDTSFTSKTRKTSRLYQAFSGYRPASSTGGTLKYTCMGTSSEIYEIQPLYNLSKVQPAGNKKLSMMAGETLYLDDIVLNGKNANNVDFYGFRQDYGTWSLVNEDGSPADESVASFKTEPQSGNRILCANGKGTIYLKYTVDSSKYFKITGEKKTDTGTEILTAPTANDNVFTAIPVIVTASPTAQAQYEVRVNGSAEVLTNEDVNLNQLSTISGAAYEVDGSHEKISNAVTWSAEDKPEDGIRITNNVMTITKPGTYRIHASYQGCYSEDWVTITAKHASDTSLTSLMIDGVECYQDGFTAYSNTVLNEKDSVSVKATPNSRATVKIEGTAGSAKDTYALEVGDNTIQVIVTAEDGTEQVYPLNIKRQAVYTVTASAGEGGTISPNGETTVASGSDATYQITPNENYIITELLVDGKSVDVTDSSNMEYTFKNVTDAHTIEAKFTPVYTVTASAGEGGTISPNGASAVVSGSDVTYQITPNKNYIITELLVDGKSAEITDISGMKYTFEKVTDAHTIEAKFSQGAICEGTRTVSLSDGTWLMYFGTKEAGEFTFAQSGGGWTIQDADGMYLATASGKLTRTKSPFVWSYSNKKFSVKEESTGSRWSWLWGSRNKSTTYYLSWNDGITVSTSTANAQVTLQEHYRNAKHSFGKWISGGDGTHTRTCTECGTTESAACSYDEETHNCTVCGAHDPTDVPDATIDVSVDVTKTTSGFLWWKQTVYRAAINVKATGTEATKVEYSMDRSNWNTGTSFTNRSEITKFYVRVTDSSSATHLYEYNNGTVTALD